MLKTVLPPFEINDLLWCPISLTLELNCWA